MIKVSVIVPIYNVERYLDKCLYYLVNQTLEEIEILCVNDGSKDNSQKIVNQYVNQYPNKVKSLIKENGGLSDSRNYGLEYATGQFVVFIDSDDWIELNSLETMYSLAVEKKYDVVVCGIRNVNEYGKEIGRFGVFSDEEITKEELLLQSNCSTNLLYKRTLLDNIKFPIGIWYEDLATVPVIVANCDKIGTVNRVFYNYLYRNDSITRTYNTKILDILVAFEHIQSCQKYSNEYLKQLFALHTYFTVIRANQIENKEDQFFVLEQLYNYLSQQFGIDSLKSSLTYSGLNEKILMSLFFKHQFKCLMAILSFEWKIKKILVSKK